MNKLNIAASGYPGTTESWKFLHEMSADLAAIIGRMIHRDDPVIITGCNVAGGNISDGYISYAGEVYRFSGGPLTNTVVLVEEVTNAEYYTDLANSGTMPSYPTYIRRYAKCGNAGEGFANVPLADFVRLSELANIDNRTKQATENTAGIAEIATQAEANADTDDTRMITPKKLAARTATETRKGLAEIATQFEVNAGADDTKIVTPAKLQEKLNNSTFGVVAEFVIDNVDMNGQTGVEHYSISGVNNYVVLASLLFDENQYDTEWFRWFISNKSATGFDFVYEVGSQNNPQNYAKIQIVILKVS